MNKEKQEEFERVQTLAMQDPRYKEAEGAYEELAKAWDDFQQSCQKSLLTMGSDGTTLEETGMEMRARELQMWLTQSADALIRRRLFSLMGEIGGNEGPGLKVMPGAEQEEAPNAEV